MNLKGRTTVVRRVCFAYIGGQVLLSLFDLIYKFVNDCLF